MLRKFYEMPGSKTALKRWVKENIPTTGDNILHGKFNNGGARKEGIQSLGRTGIHRSARGREGHKGRKT